MTDISIRPVRAGDSKQWLAQREALWPGARAAEHRADIGKFFSAERREPLEVLAAFQECEIIGFIELSVRYYAQGCDTQNVAYVEGWYVAPRQRGRGIGAALITAAEQWGRRQGCTELASDSYADNNDSIAAHHAVGFRDTGLIRCFKKDLGNE